ncbi:dimethylarginine dimethylaminohydrolase family protein [Paenibacillus tarimensis]|uniref:dimethylarginine dimethylaminohydrolase family protein n=1 Tax=Paenibacillus tarimensis TaxID=416012 RepID=UPI001F3180C9|nr:arginine deiminase family protein [Paenibacillus tarimensis]MCF2945055.1 arginine deiminase family protein [Paenibacillus tarimensis]
MIMFDRERLFSEQGVREPFHDEALLKLLWGERWGLRHPTGTLKKVLVHRPGREILELHRKRYEVEAGSLLLKNVAGRMISSNGRGQPDLELVQKQHDQLVEALRAEGVEIVYLEGGSHLLPDRLYTRDLGMVVPGGIIMGRFALYLRLGETRFAVETLTRLGMPILGLIQGNAFAEGGSFSMIHDNLAVVGRSERFNQAGIEQLRNILDIHHIELLAVDLPAGKIHLDEAFMMLDRDKALINRDLLPYWFLTHLQDLGIQLIHVDPEDPLLTINCLAVRPGRVIFPASGVRTSKLLQENGVEVVPVDVSEMYKMGGGIHCMTLPLIRLDN